MCNHRSIKYTRHIRISIHYISTFRSSFTLCLSVYYCNTHTHTVYVSVCACIITTVDPFSTIQLAISLSLSLSLSFTFSFSFSSVLLSTLSISIILLHTLTHAFIHFSSCLLLLFFLYLCTNILSISALNANSGGVYARAFLFYYFAGFVFFPSLYSFAEYHHSYLISSSIYNNPSTFSIQWWNDC